MKVGTKSLLFGVHQFLYHPWTVARAWRRLYRRWPTFEEAICIFCHDLGYGGKPNMDGPEGRSHPELGADIAAELVYLWRELRGHPEEVCDSGYLWAWHLTINHSTHSANARGQHTSMLYLADKASILCEYRWFYLLRARLSGELTEYIANSPIEAEITCVNQPRCWFRYYSDRVRQQVFRHEVSAFNMKKFINLLCLLFVLWNYEPGVIDTLEYQEYIGGPWTEVAGPYLLTPGGVDYKVPIDTTLAQAFFRVKRVWKTVP